MTDPLNRETTFSYTAHGALDSLTLPDPDGAGPLAAPVYQSQYDDAGNLTVSTNPLGQATTYAFDNLYRLTSITQPDPDGAGGLSAPVTSFEHDLVGNLTKLTDPVNNETSWTYDALDRVTVETNPLNDLRQYSYDAVGNVTHYTDRNGRVREFDFDNLYRLTEERWKDGATTVNTLQFGFDAAGQMTSASDDHSSYLYTLDNLGRATQIEIDNGGPQIRLSQQFNAAGSRTQLATEIDTGSGYVADLENAYSYDNLQRMTRVEQAGVSGGNVVAEKRVDFSYDAAGRFTNISRYKDLAGGGANLVAETDFVYDALGRVTDLTHFEGSTTFADYNLAYDVASRVTQLSFTSLVGTSGTSDYSYDHTDQLTAADHDYQADEAYAFDENGNRTMTGYSTGTNNRLLSDGTFNYEYDAEGNRTRRVRISPDPADDYETLYTWDHRNQLTRLAYKDNSGNVTKQIDYTYDVFNRRIAKSIDWDGAGSGSAETVEYVLDGAHLLLALDSAGDPTNRYLHGPAVDQILADEQVSSTGSAGDTLWALTDYLGSVRDLVDSDGNVDNHITYDAFGNVASETASAVDHIFGYTGRERDEESDLQYNRARYLDTGVGRWISEDPIGFAAGDDNLGRYVGNGPTNATDPSGYWANKYRGASFEIDYGTDSRSRVKIVINRIAVTVPLLVLNERDEFAAVEIGMVDMDWHQPLFGRKGRFIPRSGESIHLGEAFGGNEISPQKLSAVVSAMREYAEAHGLPPIEVWDEFVAGYLKAYTSEDPVTKFLLEHPDAIYGHPKDQGAGRPVLNGPTVAYAPREIWTARVDRPLSTLPEELLANATAGIVDVPNFVHLRRPKAPRPNLDSLPGPNYSHPPRRTREHPLSANLQRRGQQLLDRGAPRRAAIDHFMRLGESEAIRVREVEFHHETNNGRDYFYFSARGKNGEFHPIRYDSDSEVETSTLLFGGKEIIWNWLGLPLAHDFDTTPNY